MFYIFVEGSDDERFYKYYYGFSNEIRIIEYSHIKKEKIQKFIQSIALMPSSDYIFTSDADNETVEHKLNIINEGYEIASKKKIVICQMEIESWYLAGISDEVKRELAVENDYVITDNLAKEDFNAMIPRNYRRYEFMIAIMRRFNKEIGQKRNKSFAYFYKHFDNILIELNKSS